MSKVYLVQAEHWYIPGRVTSIHESKSGAINKAVELTQGLVDDSDLVSGQVNADNWENMVTELQDCHGAQYCYVSLDEVELLS